MIGRTLGHYEIVDHLGAGGMGEVYRARDNHLDRDVAIKVLPEGLDSDPDRLARFEREAKLLAQLDHPNIATVYDLEESDGIRFIAMEAVEGETLAEHLERGPLPVELALGIATHIAEALEAAHAKGIIHRDLKPANVMLTPDVKVKVLDFGLAKAFEAEAPIANLSHSPTMAAATQAGVILGTAAYMSPEQARGRPLDRRTDIWSFGCVLFEMLTGRKPFAGADVSDMIATILRDEPDWNLLPATTPPMARALLHRCLRRDPDRRLHDIADARIEIEDALGVSGEVVVELPAATPQAEPSAQWQRYLPWGLFVVAAAVAGITAWSSRDSSSPAPSRTAQFEMRLSDGAALDFGSVLSPDGSGIAYALWGDASTAGVYFRRIDELEGVRLVPGDAYWPFFSPDGRWVAYVTIEEGDIQQLWKVPTAGGTPQVMVRGPIRSRSATWGADNNIVYTGAGSGGGQLFSVSATGGDDPVQLTELGPDERMHLWPQVLPGGTGVLFTSVTDGDETAIEVFDPETRERVVIHRGGGDHARYVGTGHITFVEDDAIFALPFSLDRLRATGEPIQVLRGIGQDSASSRFSRSAPYSVAEDGTLLYVRAKRRSVTLERVSRGGDRRTLWDIGKLAVCPTISPDGSRVAVSVFNDAHATLDVWVYSLERDFATQVTSDPGTDIVFAWTPDGQELLLASERSGTGNSWMYRMSADGTGSATRLLTGSRRYESGTSMSLDGRLLAFHTLGEGTFWDIWVQELGRDSAPVLLAGGVTAEVNPHFSPDGRWIAYTVADAAFQNYNVFVQPYPPTAGGKQQVSVSGGGQPRWSKDGRELYYRTDDGVMVVDVATEQGEIRLSRPRLLFPEDFAGTTLGVVTQSYVLPDFDAAPDGQSFVLLAERGLQHMTVMFNWLDELERLVPTER